MKFNTILANIKIRKYDAFNIESLLSQFPEEPGVFFTTGKLDGKFNCTLHVGLADINLSKKLSCTLTNILDNKWYEYEIATINYRVINERSLREKIFLNLFKKFKPKISYNFHVNNHMRKYKMENKCNLVNGKLGNNYLEKKLGDLSKFTRDISEDCIFKKFNNDTICNYIKEEPGIYFLYNNKEELMYIGRSKNLKKRLFEHLSGKTNTSEVCHNFKKLKCIYMEYNLTEDYEIFFINTYKPCVNESNVLTYVTKKFDIAYNSFIKECGSFEEYLRYIYAKQDAEGWLIKGYFDNNIDNEIFSKKRKVTWTLQNLFTKAKLPFPKGTAHWRDWDKKLLNTLKEGQQITFLKSDFIDQGNEKQNEFVKEMQFRKFTFYRVI